MHDHRFLPFFGNHYERLPFPTSWRGGLVSTSYHLGKPLTARLWEDLTEKFCVTKILIYRPSDEMWTMGWGEGTEIIYLDKSDLVRDIEINPVKPALSPPVSTRPRLETLGGAILDSR